MAGKAISVRLQQAILTLFIAACAAFLVQRFWPQEDLADLLGRLPADSAVQLYVSLPGTAKVVRATGLRLPWTVGLSAESVDALVVGVAGHKLFLAARGRFGPEIIDTALEQLSAGCGEPISKAPCAVAIGPETFVVRVAGQRALLAATGPWPSQTTPPGEDLAALRGALDAGAILWAAVDPRSLDRAMQNPPSHWLNVQLAARALERAERAYAAASPLPDGALQLEIEAHCDVSETEDLRGVLAGLNDMAAAFARRDPESERRWGAMLASFESSIEGSVVRTRWTVPASSLAAVLEAAD